MLHFLVVALESIAMIVVTASAASGIIFILSLFDKDNNKDWTK